MCLEQVRGIALHNLVPSVRCEKTALGRPLAWPPCPVVPLGAPLAGAPHAVLRQAGLPARAVLCIGAIKRARYRREEQLAAAAAELDALESRRRELERLLGAD